MFSKSSKHCLDTDLSILRRHVNNRIDTLCDSFRILPKFYINMSNLRFPTLGDPNVTILTIEPYYCLKK